MERALTTCLRCGREIGFLTDEKGLKIGDRIKLLHPFCNPTCEEKGMYDSSFDGLSTIVGIDGFVMEEHIFRQRIINGAPNWFVDL